MKMTVAPIIRAFGFRRVLIANTVVCSAFLFSYSFFRPGDAACGDLPGAVGRRVFPLAADDQHQHVELCRRAPEHAEPRHQPDQHGAAAVAEHGRRDRRVSFHLVLQWLAGRRSPGPADFSSRSRRWRCCRCLSVPFFLRMSPERRRRGQRPRRRCGAPGRAASDRILREALTRPPPAECLEVAVRDPRRRPLG